MWQRKMKHINACALIPTAVQKYGKSKVYQNFPSSWFNVCSGCDCYLCDSMDSSHFQFYCFNILILF